MLMSDAYELFQRGYDTLDIARMMGRKEPDVLREINMVRSARLQKTYPYAPYFEPSESPRLGYATRRETA